MLFKIKKYISFLSKFSAINDCLEVGCLEDYIRSTAREWYNWPTNSDLLLNSLLLEWIWDLIVSVPDHCLFFYFLQALNVFDANIKSEMRSFKSNEKLQNMHKFDYRLLSFYF